MLSDALVDIVRAGLAPTGAAHVCVLSGTEVESVSVSGRGAASPARGRFLLYSITKTIMAVAALRLVSEGRLALDGRLSSPLPGFAPAGEFSLRQLLQHTSGLPDYGGLKEYHEAVRRGDEPWTDEEFLERTDANRLRSTPGSVFEYSNIGYMLLRRVLARATGEELAPLLQRLVLGPAGIEDATVPARRADLAAFVFGPSRYLGGGAPVEVARRYHPGWVAHGVVGASALSAGRFAHALFAGALLRADLLREMSGVRAVHDDSGGPWRQPAYGLGLMVDREPDGGLVLGHRGGGPGCSPSVFHFPMKRRPLTVCVITDGEDSDQPVAMIKSVAATFPA